MPLELQSAATQASHHPGWPKAPTRGNLQIIALLNAVVTISMPCQVTSAGVAHHSLQEVRAIPARRRVMDIRLICAEEQTHTMFTLSKV